MPKNVMIFFVVCCIGDVAVGTVLATFPLFLKHAGLNLLEMGMVGLFFFVILFLVEVPSGAFADYSGRKRACCLGYFIHGLSMLFYFFSSNFWSFVFCESLMAIGLSLDNSSFIGWILESLKNSEHASLQARVITTRCQIRYVGWMMGALLGSMLAFYNLSYPWLGGALFMWIACILVFFFVREHAKSGANSKDKKSFYQQIVGGLAQGWKNHTIRYFLGMSTCLFLSLKGVDMYWQVYMEQSMLKEVFWLGFCSVMVNIFLITGTFLGPLWVKRFPQYNVSMTMIHCAIAVCMILAMTSRYLIVFLSFFFLHEALRGMNESAREIYVNESIESEDRSTLLSVSNVPKYLGSAAGLLLGGVLVEWYTISATWMCLGMMLIVGSLCVYYMSPREA